MNSQVCSQVCSQVSKSACSSCSSACSSCSAKSVFAQLPSVLINIILTYIAELNGCAWFETLNPDNEELQKKFNHYSPLANQLNRAFAHKLSNYPEQIVVGINGVYIEGTIKCMLWQPDYAEGHEDGEVVEFFRSSEFIEFEVNGYSEYVILNGIYDQNMQFNPLLSFWHCQLPPHNLPQLLGGVSPSIEIKTVTFQDRDIVDMYTFIEGDEDLDWEDEDEDDYDGLADDQYNGIYWMGGGEGNNAGIGW